MAPVTELEMREFVRSVIVPEHEAFDLAVEEFVLGETGRIDLALIGRRLYGYEFKSDLDTLSRLPRQMEVYGAVFDRCTLVVTQRHIRKAREMLRPGWGLTLVRRDAAGQLAYRQVRQARETKTVTKAALAELLWRDETLRALDHLGLADGFRSKPKHLLWARLAAETDLDELRSIVTASLTARRGWRDVQAPRERVERSQHVGGSSRFLARRLQSQRR